MSWIRSGFRPAGLVHVRTREGHRSRSWRDRSSTSRIKSSDATAPESRYRDRSSRDAKRPLFWLRICLSQVVNWRSFWKPNGLATVVRIGLAAVLETHARILSIEVGKNEQSRDVHKKRKNKVLSFLFADYSARVVSEGDEYPPMFDNAVVVVMTGSVRFRFIQDRGEQRIEVAPMEVLGTWQDLGDVMASIRSNGIKPSWTSLEEASEMLRTQFSAVQRAFSEVEYPMIRQRLFDIRQNRISAFIARSNGGRSAT